MFHPLRLRGAERERRRLYETHVVARTLVDSVEVCESAGRELEVSVEMLE